MKIFPWFLFVTIMFFLFGKIKIRKDWFWVVVMLGVALGRDSVILG